MTTSPASFDSAEDLQRVAANVAQVRRRIRDAGGDERVSIVAVTKTFDVSAVRAALRVGLVAVGENYVDELEDKRRDASDLAVTWHYLGALQTNKIGRVLRVADVLSGVSRLREVERIAAHRPGATIDVQVDLTGQARRNGAPASEVAALVSRARDEGLVVRGLMTVASPDRARAREEFRRVNEMAGEMGLAGRSMGMSDDLEIAVQEGSTEVRVGRALFGPRTSSAGLA
jgi:uncharacterized pyridoxal phosphate-containing UPF0001 family protein